MIKHLIGTLVSACCATGCLFGLSLVTVQANALAPTCQDIFGIPKVTTVERATRGRFTVDQRTKQNREELFVPIRGGRELFVDYLKPAPGKPTIVLVNGLTYRTGIWDKFVDDLKGEGLGILRYDPVGMGKTMEKYGPPKGPVTMTEQVEDLHSLITSLGIDNQKLHFLGLSYGGGLVIEYAATFPEQVATVIPMSAYTAALASQVKQIQAQISWTRTMFPWNKATDAELYAYFLKQTVYATYPMTEPIVLEHPYKLESVYWLALGATSFNADFYAGSLPPGTVHQITARLDEYIPAEVPERFWQLIPKEARASRIIMNSAKHKIPEDWPHFSAEWVKLIIKGDPRIQDGRTWDGGGLLKTAVSAGEHIQVEK